MLRKLVYKGDKSFLVLAPMFQQVEKGTELEVNNKEHADQLIELGFEEVKETKKTKKEGEE